MLNLLCGDPKYLAYTFDLRCYLLKFLFSPHPFSVRVGGVELLVKPRSSDLFTIFEIFSDQCYSPKMGNVSLDIQTVVDFGANIGAFSIWVSQFFNPKVVIAVEMDPECYRQLLDNVAINKLNNTIRPIHAAIFNRSGVVGEQRIPGSSFYRVAPAGKGQPVRAISFKDFLDRSGLEMIDLLKIDIEGTEKYLLTDENRRLFQDRVRYILLETHTLNDFRIEQAITYLSGLGFRLVMTPTPYILDRNYIVDAYNPGL